ISTTSPPTTAFPCASRSWDESCINFPVLPHYYQRLALSAGVCLMANPSLGAFLRHLHGLVEGPFLAETADGQLLERFVSHHGEAAFAALRHRHGPMVLSVCRRALANEQDREDVFQAAFLLLARKASSIRKRESVGSWLHGVAHRLAVRCRSQEFHRRV